MTLTADLTTTTTEPDPRDPLLRLQNLFDPGTAQTLHPRNSSGVLAARGTVGGTPAIAYATDALSKGVPDATVAALLGHSGTAMLHKHYSHLTSRIAVLKDALAKVR